MADFLRIIYRRLAIDEPGLGEDSVMTRKSLEQILSTEAHKRTNKPAKIHQSLNILKERINWDPEGLLIEEEGVMDRIARLIKGLVVQGAVSKEVLETFLEELVFVDTPARWNYLFGSTGIVSFASNGVIAFTVTETIEGRPIKITKQFIVAADMRLEAFKTVVQGFISALNNEAIAGDAELINLYHKALDHLYWESQGILEEEEREEILEAFERR